MTIKNSARLIINTVLAIALCGFVLSCGGGGDSDSGGASGQSGSIALTTDVTSIPADGSSSATITATITDSAGNPVCHYTEVRFTTDLGHFRKGSKSYTMQTQPPLGPDGFPNPDAAPTGIAQVQFIAGTTAGAAKITVSSNGVTNATYVSLTGVSGAIVLTASPVSILADGSSASTITATLTDSGGNPVTPGTEVIFTTGLGSFQNGKKSYTLTTPDTTGVVQVALNAGVVPGKTYVSASSQGITQSIRIELLNNNRSQMSIAANPQSIIANGTSKSIVTATVKDLAGNPIPEVPVTFYDVSGGEPDPLPPLDTYEGTGPEVTSTFYSNGGLTTFTLSHDGSSNFIVWLWNKDTGERIDLLVNEIGIVTDAIAVENLAAGNYFFEVRYADGDWSIKIDGDIVPTPTPVVIDVIGITETDLNGNAKYTYTSDTQIKTVVIKAEAGEVTNTEESLSEKVNIIQTGGTVAKDITVEAIPNPIYANGGSFTTIKATVTDAFGNEVADGTVVNFISTLGTLEKSSATTTAGIASVKLTPIAGATTTESIVTATVGTISNSVTVTFTGVSLTNMAATPAAIFANGTDKSTITVRLVDSSGVAISGETIVFSTTGGTLTAASSITSTEGVATTELIAPTATGTATITATYGTFTANVGISFERVQDGSITLNADPATIPADGASSTVITATIKYSSGAAVPKGTSVTFTTNLGTFLDGSQSYTTITPDETGAVSVTLKAGTTAGAAQVTVSAINISQTIYVGMGGAAVSIALVANPTSIAADGSSSSLITATVTDSTGATVTPGTSVTFTTDLGTFAGGGTSITTSTTDDTGTVSVSLISATTAGSATVTATSSGVSQSVNVTFSGGVVGAITVTANPNTLPADGTSTSVIRADVRDGQGNPVPDGESVSFVILTGTGTLSAASAQTVGGFAEVTYTASKTSGTETIRAMSANNVSATVDITLTGSLIGSIQVSANPSAIAADGSSSEITALVKSPDNQVIPDAEVTFKTSRGAITSPHTTDASGKAVATLISERYNDPSVLVTATCQGVEGTVLVSFTGLDVSVAADPTSVLAGPNEEGKLEFSTITATFKDPSGNPINGAFLTFKTDKGKFETGAMEETKTSNSSGQAEVKLSSESSGVATVTVTSQGAEGKVKVNFTRYLFKMKANPSTIRVGETSEITATILDTGSAKSNQTVSFSSSLGTLSDYTKITDAKGEAATTLTAGTQSGTATVDGTVTIDPSTPPVSLSANTKVVIVGGTATKVVLTANPNVISTNSGVATLTATVYDVNDQPSQNQEIYFRINKSPGGGEYLSSSMKITNSFGVATVQFHAGSLPSAFEKVEIEANTDPAFGGSYGLTTLTIAGPVANIGIGMNLETVEPQGGDLTVDISAIATDVSGNPVGDGTLVTFAVKAILFDEDRANDQIIDCWDSNGNILDPCPPVGTPGFGFTWFSDDVNQDGKMYGCNNVTCQVGPMCSTEDVNHNGILDPGEDKNDNGVIDPIQGCVIDTSVQTTDGIARAKLVYPQPQANNITVRVTAEAGGISNFYDAILLCTNTMVLNGNCGIGY